MLELSDGLCNEISEYGLEKKNEPNTRTNVTDVMNMFIKMILSRNIFSLRHIKFLDRRMSCTNTSC
jgi:hypothetical protein